MCELYRYLMILIIQPFVDLLQLVALKLSIWKMKLCSQDCFLMASREQIKIRAYQGLLSNHRERAIIVHTWRKMPHGSRAVTRQVCCSPQMMPASGILHQTTAPHHRESRDEFNEVCLAKNSNDKVCCVHKVSVLSRHWVARMLSRQSLDFFFCLFKVTPLFLQCICVWLSNWKVFS